MVFERKGGEYMLEEKSVKNWLKRKVRFTQALLVAFLITGGIGYAADKNAVVFDEKDSIKSTDAEVSHEIFQDPDKFPEGEGQSIAIGKKANAYMQGGNKARGMLFGMKKATGAIAIGENAVALSQAISIGNRVYDGLLGDVNLKEYNSYKTYGAVGSTLLGNNSFAGGTLSTLIGSYSIMSTSYPDKNMAAYMQNAGAVSVGALNSIESATSDVSSFFGIPTSPASGVANSVVGLANRTNNANGSLIYGAGNEITNSLASVAEPSFTNSAKEAADTLRSKIKKNPGGATMAFGGGNKANWTQLTSMIGVNNTITGDKDNVAKYNMISGYKNTITKSSENLVSGTNWSVSGEGKNILMGFNKEENKVEKKNVVALGNDIKVNTDNSVYLGSGSTEATTGTKGMEEYSKAKINGKEKTFAGGTPAGIVSVGSKGKERRIQNVAAGLISSDSTDAVNGSQLFAVAEELKNKVNAPITADKITEKGSINDSADIKVTGTGTDRLVGTGNISFTIKDNAVTKKKLSTEVQNTLDRVGKGEITEGDNNTVTGDTVYKYKVENDQKLDRKVEKEEFHNYQNTTNDRMNKMESETHHVGALSASLAALHPMQYDPLQKSQVMAGVGTYRDKQAIAVGVSHYFNENLMMTAGVSLGEDTKTKSMANLGITWKIGSDDDRKDLPERYKEGPIGSIYMMQTEMEQVMNENKDLKKLTQTQQKEIETMKQQIQMLMEKVK